MSSDDSFPAMVGVGASAGGVEALLELVAALPADLASPVLVVLHVAPTGTSVLAALLDRRSQLEVLNAADGMKLEAGRVYVAPPDRHLKLIDGHIHLDREPRVNGHRPAVDPLLRSIANAYGPRSVGVVLSGIRDDGTPGAVAVKHVGGRVYVQDPDEALYRSMPDNVRAAVEVDGCQSVADLARTLAQLEPPDDTGGHSSDTDEPEATRFTCPDCGGVIWRHIVAGVPSFACSVGHEYSAESLADEQARQLESALWAAVRTLEDRAELLDFMARRADSGGRPETASRHRRRGDLALEQARAIRDVIAQPSEEPDSA